MRDRGLRFGCFSTDLPTEYGGKAHSEATYVPYDAIYLISRSSFLRKRGHRDSEHPKRSEVKVRLPDPT
jgi:hypothetical protein